MFSPVKNKKIYEEVIEQIKDMIYKGILKKGDKLPSERDMVEKLQVSRTSVREALRSLEIVGLIESRQGEGNFIKEDFEDGLIEPLSVMFMLQDSKSEEILELRKIIEVGTIKLAAERITESELEKLNELKEKLKTPNKEENLAEIDREFHYKIAAASKNFLLLGVLNAISALMESYIKDARKSILEEEGNRQELITQHENIFEALNNNSEDEAVEAMTKHLDFANKYMINR
ncbi:FadR family transcriptional regulator [Clostridium tetani]|uniref:Transcriptional regulator, putative pyruvate dehydrogenase complex repressor n=1 Tax=Clostridium tetani (strain Massachusetts / E88) TaxID=212717 RepID=Q896N0_CLOTE|nr:FadR/GntR family transcriptional regulator [Clostridium tetani]AAO35560.1 transcriptional regulator, putative pyruvate dehydrogenase complex repressor [Clostridium tetani E88]KGI37042.1 GntR family transcriptional regulator [Clostridium tetani]KGI40433.1 GntR family transcriptional regulator [Clostridium tetani ATCC 9441]KGI46279.1 GntR family transcriptional regulator [Clostridium tetani]KHO36394.1 GntR family transcriptional regulator [Clostridium tetani]